MAHEMVTWRLHKKGVVLVIIGMLFFTAFVFAAGYLTAILTTRATKAAAMTTRGPSPPAPLPASRGEGGSEHSEEPGEGRSTQHTEPLALQVAIFPSEEEAGEFVKTLAEKELEGTVVAMPTREGPVLYGVEVGEYIGRRDALAAADVMQRKHGLTATVVPASKHQISHSPKP